MSKFSFLVYHHDYQIFLDQVRELGVVHLIEKQADVSDNLRDQYDQIKQVTALGKILAKRRPDDAPDILTPGKNGKQLYEECAALLDELEQKNQQHQHLVKEISQIRHWGDYSEEILKKLREEGIFLKYYTVSVKKFDPAWTEKYPIEVLGQHAGLYYFVMVLRESDTREDSSQSTEAEIDAEEMRQPEKPVSVLQAYLKALEEDIRNIHSRLDRHAAESLGAIRTYQLELTENLAYDKAVENTEKQAEDKVMLLEGWVPDARKDALLDYLEKSGMLFIHSKPDKKEKVPVLLSNNKFASKFEMLGELYSLPKYGELDMTPFFAPFYMLFFGFCLGDVGYGLMMAAGAILMRSRVKKQMKNVLGLVFYLGLSTILFGLIGGTFFGIPLYETGLPIYRDLAASFEARDTDINQLLFYLALVFGGIQILFGMFLKLVNEVKQMGWGFAIGTLGWIILLLGGIGLYAFHLISGTPQEALSLPGYILLGVSGLMILPLNNLSRNILMNVGAGLWNTYNMITGLLGDLLSYIRLFALGISSAIMGFVFNSLAVEMSGSIPVLNILIMIVILVIGHSINIFMSGLGAFVHPMRLTFVEFYKNAGFSGGGKKYNPFRKIT